MKKNNFNRRKFLASMAILSMGQMIPVSILSFPVSDKEYSSIQNDLLWYIDSKGKRKKVKTGRDWEMKRMQILTGMQEAMGPLPSFVGLPNMDIKIFEEVKEQNYTRQNIVFTVAPNEMVSAYLYTPDKKIKQEKLPAILALHSTGRLGKKIVDGQSSVPNRAYAKELASLGYVVIAPDYPGFGDMADYNFENDRYISGTMKGIFDNMRCVDLLQSMPDVNPDCIGVIGHSLGGHNALFTAAFDKRLKVVVASCGWTLFDYYNPGENSTVNAKDVLAPWAQDLYMPRLREKYLLDNKNFPFDFDEVIATIAPRPFFSNSPLHDANFNVEGVKKGMKNASAVYNFLGAKKSPEGHYPDSGHDFPPDIRTEAYQFIDRILK
jgi:dienelactone hydrolase